MRVPPLPSLCVFTPSFKHPLPLSLLARLQLIKPPWRLDRCLMSECSGAHQGVLVSLTLLCSASLCPVALPPPPSPSTDTLAHCPSYPSPVATATPTRQYYINRLHWHLTPLLSICWTLFTFWNYVKNSPKYNRLVFQTCGTQKCECPFCFGALIL